MRRKKPHSSALILLLVAIFGAWWGVSVLAHYSRVGTQVTAIATDPGTYTAQHPLSVTALRSANELTYEGIYALSACESLGAGIALKGNPSHVSLQFSSRKATVACAQAATFEKNPFSFSIDLKKDAPMPVFDGVYLNGVRVPSTLVVSN